MTEPTPVRVTGYDEVVAAFADPRLAVPEPDGTGPMDAFRRAVPRFAEGERHAERRAAVEETRAGVTAEAVRARAYERMGAHLRAAAGRRIDLMPVLRTLPVAALAEALGVPAERCDAVAGDVAALAPAYLPGAGAAAIAEADAAVTRLSARIGAERLPTLGCLLAQACAAVAALAAAALRDTLPRPRDARPAAMATLRSILRNDPPLRAAVRTARAPITVAGRDLVPGATIFLALTGGADAGEYGLAFGSGPHRCPGADLAVALACGVVEAADGCALANLVDDENENAWVPRALEVIA